MSIAVLSPAPCLPALLHPGELDFDLTIDCGAAPQSELSSWSRDLQLQDVLDGSALELRARSIARPAADEAGTGIRQLAALTASGNPTLARIRLTLGREPKVTPPRRTRVFDLVHAGNVIRPRCVASLDAPDGILRIAFASDLHLAAVWNDIAEAIDRHGPEWASRLLHPSRLFERMVAELEPLCASGEMDLLVLGGDLVDHVYRRSQARGAAIGATNISLLLDRIRRLPAPIYAIPGNHDYRLFPWRVRIYPFSGTGIPQAEARRIMKRAGLWDSWPVHPRDLDSLRTQETNGTSALRHHLSNLAPATDFTTDIGPLRLIFLSTGRDVLPRWREVERGRLGMLLRSIPVSYHHPDCEGFSDEQITGLATALMDCRKAVLFFHAPLLNPPPGSTIDSRLRRLDLPEDERLAARIGFERRLFGSGLRHGVFFRNPASFVRTLASFPGSLTTFSGHVHGTHAAELDPKTLAVRSIPVAQAHSNGVHALLNAPALGQTATRDGESPGYLLARFDDGRLTSLQRCALAADPL